jgi:prophage regulatory protein
MLTQPDVHASDQAIDEPGFLRLPEVMRLTGLSRSTIYAMMARGEFPAQIKIGARAVAWWGPDIKRWILARYAATSSHSFRTAPSATSAAIQRANRQVVKR